ncbi:MAG TPA: deoxyguanosinetriphosphate triphosphohydrolase [Clostridiales bacterium]|nr:deoxyguanosinetriphosphate triphosphohydrolase [Clostridiales bacterium]
MPSIREQTLEYERQFLSDKAFHCSYTKGRLREEKECPVRTALQRDRHKIIHSNAFRRLKDKTQVFLSPEGDHYRTRLTHTLEVSQIARTITRALRLNEDLTEAIALGHDLGHTPFGHAGERALDSVYDGGFRHYEQSLRVVDFLERDGMGLNLSYEVRDGILCHTTGKMPETLEGRVVRIADKIAYINHDIEDGIRAGIMSEDDIPKYISNVLGKSKSERIETLVTSLIENSKNDINFSSEVLEAFNSLHEFMFKCLYTNPKCKGEEGKAVILIQKLYEYYCENPDKLPEFYRKISIKEGVGRAACDYISGMSDRYCKTIYTRLFIPHFWEE